ncbi:MAG: hypothetical protein Q9157_002645 [Trypethelium eluteriae]
MDRIRSLSSRKRLWFIRSLILSFVTLVFLATWTLLSAAIAGYSTPVLINWETEFNSTELVDGGSHLAKISGVLEWLDTLRPERDDDLVLMVDGYDVWFQLRPETLIRRYNQINREAAARTKQRLGPAFKKERLQQSVIFSAQKRCFPWSDDAIPCYAVPESALPPDVYGPDTDIQIDPDWPYQTIRPRWINSGIIIGPVAQMRSMFHRTLQKLHEDPNFGSDQRLFNSVFGEQEYQREVMRQRYRSPLSHLHSSNSFLSRTDVAQMPHYSSSPLDFGISLDYFSSLGHATVFAETDSAWFLHSDKTLRGSEPLQLPDPHPLGASHIQSLSDDIKQSLPPFAGTGNQKAWEDVPLYTNLYTGVTPAIIHNNAHRYGLKSVRETAWDQMWFFPRAREMLDLAIQKGTQPLAVTKDLRMDPAKNENRVRRWWSAVELKGGAWSGKEREGGRWLRFGDMCPDAEALFRDQKGEWVDPIQDVAWALKDSP